MQVCWEKFCNYWDVEPRTCRFSGAPGARRARLDQYVDENTIGVVAIMGVTYTGMYEPVNEIAAPSTRSRQTGWTCRSTSTGHPAP